MQRMLCIFGVWFQSLHPTVVFLRFGFFGFFLRVCWWRWWRSWGKM